MSAAAISSGSSQPTTDQEGIVAVVVVVGVIGVVVAVATAVVVVCSWKLATTVVCS